MKALFIKGMTVKHTAKMESMVSFSTSNLVNTFCEKMKTIEGSICKRCFANNQLKMQPSTAKKLAANDWVKYDVIKKKDAPFINAAYFRFEAFGELSTMQQLENYMTIAKNNKHCNFTLFTKRADLLRAFSGKKPTNFLIMLSSPMINKQAEADGISDLIHGVFTVYDKKCVKDKEIKINCGSKKCIDCLLCYKKSKKLRVINELLK